MSSLLDNSTSQLLQQMARFTEQRHEVLTANVAHATTPGYERRDLDVDGFRAALTEAIEATRNPPPVSQSLGAVPAPTPQLDRIDPEVFVPKADTERHLRFHDGGVRSVETEMTELSKNSMMHDVALRLLAAQFDQLQTVISERA